MDGLTEGRTVHWVIPGSKYSAGKHRPGIVTEVPSTSTSIPSERTQPSVEWQSAPVE